MTITGKPNVIRAKSLKINENMTNIPPRKVETKRK